MIHYYESHFQQILLCELEECLKVVRSSEVTDQNKAETVLMGAHQWHLIRRPTKKDIIINTLSETRLWDGKYVDFEDVYRAVVDTIGHLEQVGPLTCYDVAKRIAYCCGIEPKRYVYLQRGARVGAMRLLNLSRLSNYCMETSHFEAILPGLSALHIENFLCIMKDNFNAGKVNEESEIRLNLSKLRCTNRCGNKNLENC